MKTAEMSTHEWWHAMANDPDCEFTDDELTILALERALETGDAQYVFQTMKTRAMLQANAEKDRRTWLYVCMAWWILVAVGLAWRFVF